MFECIDTHELAEVILRRQNRGIDAELFVKFQPNNCFLPKDYAQYCEYIKNLPIRDDDVWVVSFMKSGTTWAQEMAWMIGNDLDYEGAKSLISTRFPFFEYITYGWPFLKNDTISKNVETITEMLKGNIITNVKLNLQPTPTSIEIVNRMSSPRFIKSHLPLNLLPSQIETREKQPKIIHVARNPKDVCVSLYHHRVLIDGYIGTIDEFVQEFVADLCMYAPYWTHVKEFCERRNEPNILFLTYEEMKKDLSSAVKRTAEFLGKNILQAEMKTLLNHLSFESMKANPYVNYNEFTDNRLNLHGQSRKTHFIRKGKVGVWKQELSSDSIKKLDEWIAKNRIPGLWDDCIF